jgi:hypothetical protein
MAQHEVYVAFSIHNTNAFITANKQVDEKPVSTVTIDGLGFTVGRSRDGKSLRGSTKLLANDLNGSTGKPVSNPKEILAFFEKLEGLGWTVDSKRFKDKHKAKLTPEPKKVAKKVAETKPEPVAETPVEETATAPVPNVPDPVETPTPETPVEPEAHPEQVDDPSLPDTASDVPETK